MLYKTNFFLFRHTLQFSQKTLPIVKFLMQTKRLHELQILFDKQGITGSKGAQGGRGPKGDQGSPGIEGPSGPKGDKVN